MHYAYPYNFKRVRAACHILQVLTATDCAACSDGMGVQAELRLLAGIASAQASFSPAADDFMGEAFLAKVSQAEFSQADAAAAASLVDPASSERTAGSECSADSEGVCEEALTAAEAGKAALAEAVVGKEMAEAKAAVAEADALAAGLAAERARVFSSAAGLRDPGWALSTVWDSPGRAHPKAPCGRPASGCLASLLVWDADHPSVWPALGDGGVGSGGGRDGGSDYGSCGGSGGCDPRPALVLCSGAPNAIDSMLVAGRWVGRPPRAAAGAAPDGDDPDGDTPMQASFHGAVTGSAAFRSHQREARDRLGRLLERAGLRKKRP